MRKMTFAKYQIEEVRAVRKELDDALCRDYPLLFKDRHGDKKDTLMCWGFECGDGWEPLIRVLCSSLMWDGRTGKDRTDPPVVVQVKEKFGTLRFYVHGGNERDWDKISFAEVLSSTICEACGATANVSQSNGWVKTRCLTCHQEEGNIPYGN